MRGDGRLYVSDFTWSGNRCIRFETYLVEPPGKLEIRLVEKNNFIPSLKDLSANNDVRFREKCPG
jgi:hypothetical protein